MFKFSCFLVLLLIRSLLLAQETNFNVNLYFSQAQIDAANTAIDLDYITDEEKDIFLYCNLARMYPRKFYEFYKAYLKKDSRHGLLKSEYYHRTLGEELQTIKSMGALLPDRKMFELAECWAIEAGEAGHVGHDRFACSKGFSGECCSYGWNTGIKIVFQLLIDRGVESLGHRKIILSPGYKGMGTAIREHTGYQFNAVLDFTYTNDVLRAENEQRRLEAERKAKEHAAKVEKRKALLGELMAEWKESEIKKADLGRSVSYLNEFEKDMYLYINLVRLYPKKFKNLIWDNGPYFDRLLDDQKYEREDFQYRKVQQVLSSIKPSEAFIPTRVQVLAARCIAEKNNWGTNNPTDCYLKTGFRSWRVDSFYYENNHNGIMDLFLNSDDFSDIFYKAAVVTIQDGIKMKLLK